MIILIKQGKTMKRILFFLLISATMLMAEADQSKFVKVYWKAFKTFEKIGVDGEFTSVKFTPKQLKAKNLKSLLLGAKIAIDTSKVETNNIGRNKKVVTMFFGKLAGNITGEIVKAEAKTTNSGTIIAKITMNKKDVLIPMKYTFDYKHNQLVAIGVLDIFDFEGNAALKSMNTECFDLHKGKTWNDVEIEFRIHIEGYGGKNVQGIFG